MQTRDGNKVDFLVLGSGIAGLRAAIELAAAGRTLVLSKGELLESNTGYAPGGIAAAMGEDDEVHPHLYDTLQAGDGLCREDAVRSLVEKGPEQIHRLVEWGMRFDRNGTKVAVTREGAHSRSRVLHPSGDSTGSEIWRALMAKAKALATIELRARAFAVDFVMDGDRVAGVTYWDEATSAVREVLASAVLLSTGGLGQAYQETSNLPLATGDGVAMAWRAGAVVSDMEFIQFHPTALSVKGAPRFLLSEAIRGEGAHLRNILLERFMPRYSEAAELAPRDVVSRAIVMEMQKTRSDFVYLDLTGLDAERVAKRFPRIYSTCLQYNIDITADLVPVRPAAHYAIGGAATDLDGATSLPGLYAAGEVAATGVHGANCLAGNFLLEGLVFGGLAATAMIGRRGPAQFAAPAAPPRPASEFGGPAEHDSRLDVEKLTQRVRALLWEKVGIMRSGKDLCEAVKHLVSVSLAAPSKPHRRHYEAKNTLEVARLIARSALARQESRGAHYRSDFPSKNNSVPPKHSYVSKNTSVFFR